MHLRWNLPLVVLAFIFASHAAVLLASEDNAELTPLLPSIDRAIKSTLTAKRGEISGLLQARQSCLDPGYGLCSKTQSCCPIGGDCCSNGRCCDPGQWCAGPGFCCYTSQRSCSGRGCCDPGETCCSDGRCCYAGYYCVVASNGQIGCCPNGTLCSGSVQNPPPRTTTKDPAPPRTTTKDPAPPRTTTRDPAPPATTDTHTRSTTTTRNTITSTASTSTSYLPGRTAVPSPGFGSKYVSVSVQDSQISWSGSAWIIGTSSCNATAESKKTSTSGHSLTYTANRASAIYFKVHTRNSYCDVVFTAQSITYQERVIGNDNCTDTWFGREFSGDVSITVAIYVYQMTVLPRQSTDDSSWSFEFNEFMIDVPDTSTTTSARVPTNTSSTLGGSSNSSIRRAERSLGCFYRLLASALLLVVLL